ncbi:P-loop containing nucleoside triphosphate hydrolase protein [Armillaria nabsnona]|nr:P-loop containing nucleoside triphosphate hydrolase protein [Armillaria nabsnona]
MFRKRIYCSDLFSPEKLTSTDALECALQELQSILTKDNFKHVFQELFDNESPDTILLVFSYSYIFTALSETTSLTSWFLESFPSEAADYNVTVHYKTILWLSTELLSSPFVADKDLCARYHEAAQIAPKVLQYLDSFLCSVDIRTQHHNKKGKVKPSQWKLPQVKQDDGASTLVEKYFDVLNINIPKTLSQAAILVDHILQSQRDTLKFYLKLLRHPEISTSLKECFIVSASPTELEKSTSGIVAKLPSAYPIVQLMKSALYFDTADGFGDWTVVISMNADKFLRRAHKKNLSAFNAFVEKIKELSCGHFTDDNQKRLCGSATEVPVFSAKISRSLRLVYQIDIIPDDDKETQAVKVFGIYTHAQIDNRLWSLISSQLRKKGKEYQRRCAVRGHADQAPKDIFTPTFFPLLPEVSPSETEDIPDLRPDEKAQNHARLIIEKYVTLSQPFLDTILADVDATFPYMVSSCIHSTQEKRIIEHPKSCYVIGRSGTGKTTTMLFKILLIERTSQPMASDLPRPHQVFVTKSRMLAMKVQEYFAKLAGSLAMASRTPTDVPAAPQYQADLGLVDADDIVDWRTDLPAKYSELEEKHFLLFITFDGLCDMLEADMDAQTLTARPKCHRGIITYESFLESYWSHFPEPLIKGLDPALVFSEIIGVINGSTETLSEGKRYLSRDTYLGLSKHRQSTFAGQRCEIYKLFELYMRKKKLTYGILKHFTEQGIPRQGLDHLYVDEVQDNMLIDTMVLRALCSNPNGLFWAGDTVQTISIGSSFHFNALKAFQWNIEDQYQRKHRLGAQQPPEMFQLAVNYRSHAGIVDCVHSIIDLITMFWEDSIDCLSPEMGIVDGVKPVFFKNEDCAQLKQFIFGDLGKPIEFGAQQCIIVRNETAREKLQQQVGEVGLVLTIYKSKGLEFNDVLLYNFFADLTTSLAQWCVILNGIEKSKQDPWHPPPQFDNLYHVSICNELKSLYVAITRAHEHVWIADGSEIGEPMRVFWSNKDLINNCTPGSDTLHLASSSTQEEWAAEGHELFNAKHFSQAKYCFDKAKLPFQASISDAYDLRAKARKVIGTSKQNVLEQRSCFVKAAVSFEKCAHASSKAHSKDSMTYLRICGECFEQADQKDRAAGVFLKAKEYTHAAELYRDIGKFDKAIEIVKAYENEMSPMVVEKIIKLARLAYFSNHQMIKACEIFDSVKEEVECLEEKDLDVALADVTKNRLLSFSSIKLKTMEYKTGTLQSYV